MASPYKRIFAAIDGSSAEDAVIERALDLAAQSGGERGLGPVVDARPRDLHSANSRLLAEEEERILRERLAPVFERVDADPRIPAVDFRLGVGRVGEALVEDLIEPCSPDLVVCGERGYSDFKYAFVGSVSKRLVRDAKCDVLVVKAEGAR